MNIVQYFERSALQIACQILIFLPIFCIELLYKTWGQHHLDQSGQLAGHWVMRRNSERLKLPSNIADLLKKRGLLSTFPMTFLWDEDIKASPNFFFYLKVQSFRLIMENNFIQMAASAGYVVAYTICPIFKHIIDCVQLYEYFTNGFTNIVL